MIKLHTNIFIIKDILLAKISRVHHIIIRDRGEGKRGSNKNIKATKLLLVVSLLERSLNEDPAILFVSPPVVTKCLQVQEYC